MIDLRFAVGPLGTWVAHWHSKPIYFLRREDTASVAMGLLLIGAMGLYPDRIVRQPGSKVGQARQVVQVDQ